MSYKWSTIGLHRQYCVFPRVAAPSSTGRYAILILEELEYLNHSSSCNYDLIRDH